MKYVTWLVVVVVLVWAGWAISTRSANNQVPNEAEVASSLDGSATTTGGLPGGGIGTTTASTTPTSATSTGTVSASTSVGVNAKK